MNRRYGNGYGIINQSSSGMTRSAITYSKLTQSGTYFGPATDTDWHHFAINFRTIDPVWTNATFVIDVYVDGSYAGTGTKSMYNQPFSKMMLGKTGAAGIATYVRDIRAYDRELTAEQIQAIYQEGL